ncbi:MAG: low molecular weight protein-tyrosine-phosphatase [Gammaproteobacteria bacterium]|nr:low molecular weight protein-tyrosine-phosphatase [Gammaproteobacteria bacterium]
MFADILVVCVGNICRSPMAEYLLARGAVEAGVSLRVASAGVGALVGHGADPLAVELLDEQGIDIRGHRARQLDAALVKEFELILVMEAWQQQEIESLYPFARGRVHLLGKWTQTEIADPYKKPKASFVAAFEQIDRACEAWCKKIC